MNKLYLDASVLIAAILSPEGGSAKLIQFIKLGIISGISSQTVVEEVEKHSAKIGKKVSEIRLFIKDNGILVREKTTGDEAKPYREMVVEDDLHVIAGAKLTKSDYLVTLDKKHLLKEEVKRLVKPLKIVNPEYYLKGLV